MQWSEKQWCYGEKNDNCDEATWWGDWWWRGRVCSEHDDDKKEEDNEGVQEEVLHMQKEDEDIKYWSWLEKRMPLEIFQKTITKVPANKAAIGAPQGKESSPKTNEPKRCNGPSET